MAACRGHLQRALGAGLALDVGQIGQAGLGLAGQGGSAGQGLALGLQCGHHVQQMPRLLHHQLAHGDRALRQDLHAILREQRRTNRTLSAVLWLGLGFGLGLLAARIVLTLHSQGAL